MVDTALLWTAFWIVVGAGCLGLAVRRYRAGESLLLPLAGVGLVIGRLAESAGAEGAVPGGVAAAVSVAALLFVFGVVAVGLVRRWRAWGDERADASL